MKISPIIIFILTLLSISCAPFSKTSKTLSQLQEVNTINGSYSIYPIVDTAQSIFPYNAFELFYREYGRGIKDTLKLDSSKNYQISIRIIDEQYLRVDHLENSKLLRTLKLKYYSKQDGYLYLKNKNLKISWIPYLFGGIDIVKLRIACNAKSNLIIEKVHHSSGAIFFILGDSKTWNYVNEYQRL